MKLSESDLEKLKNLKVDSKWSSLKSIKEINDEIKNLNIYDEKISQTCRNYLKNDVVKDKSFVLEKLLQKCKQIKKPKEKKPKKPKKGKSTAAQDKRLLQQNPVLPIPPKEKSYIEKNGSKIFNALVKADGDPVKALELLSKDKDFFNDTKKGLESVLMGVISYFITDTQLAQKTFTITTTIISVLAGLYRLSQLAYIKKLKKKAIDFLDFGGGGNDDDDDDDDDDDTRRDFTINLNPELRDIVNNIQNNNVDSDNQDDKKDDKQDDKKDTKQSGLFPPPQSNSTLTARSGNNEVFSFLRQQAQQQQLEQLKQARRNQDLILQEQPTQRKEPTPIKTEIPKKEPKIDREQFTSDGYTYFKYDSQDKFNERYKREFDSLRKEEKFKNFKDSDFFDAYQKAFDKQTSKDSLTDLFDNKNVDIKKTDNVVSKPAVSESLNIPETAKKETIIEPELTPMGDNLPTRPEYVTPPTYWDKLKENLPLMAVGTGMGVLYGVNVISNNILRRRQSQMTDGLLALPPSQERNDRSLIASSSAGEFRERELGVGKPLARFRYMYPSGFFSGRTSEPLSSATPPLSRERTPLSRDTSTSSLDLSEELTARTTKLRNLLEQQREQERNRIKELELREKKLSDIGMEQIQDIIKLKKENVRLEEMIDASVGFSDDELLKTNEPIKFKPIDVPHSHEEELRLDRSARQQREGGIVLQANQMTPARPSTTLTESLIQEDRDLDKIASVAIAEISKRVGEE